MNNILWDLFRVDVDSFLATEFGENFTRTTADATGQALTVVSDFTVRQDEAMIHVSKGSNAHISFPGRKLTIGELSFSL